MLMRLFFFMAAILLADPPVSAGNDAVPKGASPVDLECYRAALTGYLAQDKAQPQVGGRLDPEFRAIVASEYFDGGRLIDYFSNDPEISGFYSRTSAADRAYTNREHALLVINRYRKMNVYYDLETVRLPPKLELHRMLKVAMILHDMPIPVFVRALGRTGMSPAEIAMIRELVENDIIGDLIHGRTTVQQAYLELSDRASRASLDTKDFFKLQSFLYTMEAGAYPDVLRSHFIKHGHYKDVPNSPSFSELESLVEQDGRRVVVPQWFSRHKGQYDPAMPGVVERLLSLYPDNFSRQRPLDIAQMSNLDDLVQKLRSIQAKGGGGFPELSLIFKEPDVVQRWNEIRQQWKMVHVPPAYLPTEYELKSAFLRRLGELNELLPVDMRLPVPKLRANARPARLLAEARKLMQRQVRLARSLLPTCGYRSLEQIRAAMEKSGPDGRKIVDLLEGDGLQFVMNRPSVARESIMYQGFQNVHVTGLTSGASASDGSRHARNIAESSYEGLSVAEYEAQDDELKVQFGYVRPDPALRALAPPPMGYGDDVWIFKKSSIQDRTTFTVGDSLNQWRDKLGHKILHPDRSEEAESPASWDQVFLPWTYKMLAAPFLWANMHQVLQVTAKASIEGMRLTRPAQEHYIELQFRLPSIEDVEGFEFKQVPPQGAFLDYLKSHGIKIYDGRAPAEIYDLVLDNENRYMPRIIWYPEEWKEDEPPQNDNR